MNKKLMFGLMFGMIFLFGIAPVVSSAGWWESLEGSWHIYNQTGGTYGFVVPAGITNISVLVIGSGGGGSTAGSSGGAGGGGSGEFYFNNSYSVTPGENLSIVIGEGGGVGATGTDGGDTLFNGNTADGGGGGAAQTNNGRPGGSGSGGGGESGTSGGSSTADWGIGNDGGGGSSPRFGAGGGGAGSVGGDGSEGQGNGGDGYVVWGQTWAKGGAGAGDSYTGGYTAPTANSGSGGSAGLVANARDGADGIVIIRYPEGLSIDLFNPDDVANLEQYNINFTFSIIEESAVGFQNVSLLINDTIVSINSSGLTGNYTFTRPVSSGYYSWKIRAYDDVNTVYESPERTFTNTLPIDITLRSPDDEANLSTSTPIFSVNVTDLNSVGIKNVSLVINGSVVSTNSSSYSGIYNFTTTLSDGQYSWYIQAYDDGDNYYLSTTRNFFVGYQFYPFQYNPWAYETDTETFWIQINATNTISSPNFYYDGDTYSASVENLGGGQYNLTSSLTVPIGVENKSLYFDFSLNGETYNTGTYQQNVSLTYFSICNSTYTTPFVNFSFKDEADSSIINASIPTSSFQYYLGDGSIAKNYTFSNNSESRSVAFCATPSDKTFHVDSRIQYESTGYPQRVYNPDVLDYTNSTTNKTLYLLGDADGIYVTFQVINLAEQTISGVVVNATRTIGGETIVVGDGTTDASGSVTFWLNPDFQHSITFYKSGYSTNVFSVTPTQTSYTITLGASTSSTSDYTRGITRLIYPNQDFLENNSAYNFNFTLTSSYWEVTEFGINLTYENGTIIGTQSASTNGGTLSVNNINVTFFLSNQSHIYMDYYYIINSTYINDSRTWQMYDEGAFSIWRFFTDLKLYTNSDNFFGFDDLGRIILSLIIIIMVSGGVSLRYGVRNDAFIMSVIFGLVLFLDVGLDFLPSVKIGSNLAIDNFVTFIVAIFLLGFIIKEEMT